MLQRMMVCIYGELSHGNGIRETEKEDYEKKRQKGREVIFLMPERYACVKFLSMSYGLLQTKLKISHFYILGSKKLPSNPLALKF